MRDSLRLARKNLALAAAVFGCGLAGIPAARGQAYQFTAFTDPAAVGIVANGISGGTIVGSFTPAAGGTSQGFIYNGSTFTPVNDPLGDVNSINGASGGVVVGTYRQSALFTTSPSDGYIYNGSTFTPLDDPLATTDVIHYGGTVATGISGGTVVGWYNSAGDVGQGFTYTAASGYATLIDPQAGTEPYAGTYPSGIEGNTVVGTYYGAADPVKGLIPVAGRAKTSQRGALQNRPMC